MKKSGFHTDIISTEFESFNTITFRQDSKSQKMIPDGQKREKTKESPNKQKKIIQGDVHSIIKISKMILRNESINQ
jgi:hypothetical protein